MSEVTNNYSAKIDAIEKLLAEKDAENQQNTINAGEGRATGIALDTAFAPHISWGAVANKAIPQQGNSAQSIINAYQGAKQQATDDSMKSLLERYKATAGLAGEQEKAAYDWKKLAATQQFADTQNAKELVAKKDIIQTTQMAKAAAASEKAQKLSTKEADELRAIDNAINQYINIGDKVHTGKVKVGGVLSKGTMLPLLKGEVGEKLLLDDEQEILKTDLNNAQLSYSAAYNGGKPSRSTMSIIGEGLPDVNDSPDEFKGKLMTSIKVLQEKKRALLNRLPEEQRKKAASGEYSEDMIDRSSATPETGLEDVDAVQ